MDNVNVDAQLARNSLKTMISRGGNSKTKVGFFVGVIALEGLDWFRNNQQSLEKEAELYGNSRVGGVPPTLADINEHLRRNQVG